MPSRSRRRPGRPRPQRRPAGPWKHGPIPVLGVVGGIGSGKSAASACLAELGAFVVNADAVGHALLEQRPVREAVVARFGTRVLAAAESEGEEPKVDRRVLGGIVFADRKALTDLEAILHPWMRRTFERVIAREGRRGRSAAVVLDAAVLYEAGWDALCDKVVFVDAPRELRLERVSASRGWGDEVLRSREAAQWPAEDKKGRADAVVANAGDLDALRADVARVWESLRRPWGAGPRPAGRRPSGRPKGDGPPTPRTPGPKPGAGREPQ